VEIQTDIVGVNANRLQPWNYAMGKKTITLCSLLFVFLFLSLVCALASDIWSPVQDQEPLTDDVNHDPPGRTGGRGQSIHVNVDLALVNVTVTDPYNRVVTGLGPDNFRVFEDKVEQEVVNFSSEDVPASIGVILDLSGSMADKLGRVKQAALQFFKTANPQDEFFLIGFNNRVQLLSGFTDNVEDLQAGMLTMSAKGATALLDAIYLGLTQMKGARHSRRALLIISDGGDNHSRYSERDIKRLVREADTQLYSIGIFDSMRYGARTLEELNGPSLLNEITELTGGRAFAADDPNQLSDIATKIGEELRNQYVLGYRPSNKARDVRWRKIKIKLRVPKGLPPLSVYAKTGYYAPDL
jgi:Ca-activated chloride channel family protein